MMRIDRRDGGAPIAEAARAGQIRELEAVKASIEL
jgi:hypothetical protein